MDNHVSRRAGLLLFGLLSLGDIITIFVTDGESPPYAVAAASAVLGLVSLFLVITALREPTRPIGLLVGLRVLSAVTSLPAFLIDDVPAAARISAAAIVVLTAAGIMLTSRGRGQVEVA